MNALLTLRRPTWGRQEQPTVRLQVPDGFGSTVGANGQTFEADADGFVSVPADVAEELRSHFGKPDSTQRAASPPAAIEALLAELREVDAEKARIEADELQPLWEGRRAAEQLAAKAAEPAAVAQLEELSARRRRTIGDMLLGLAGRRDVDAIDSRRATLSAEASQARRERELAELGSDELMHRIGLVDQRLLALQARRSLVVRRLVRARAEAAGQVMRDALRAVGQAAAEVQAHALLLQELERPGSSREDTAGGRQSFPPFAGTVLRDLPAFRELQAFSDCQGGELVIAFNSRAASASGAQEVVDLDEVRRQLRAQLHADGVLV